MSKTCGSAVLDALVGSVVTLVTREGAYRKGTLTEVRSTPTEVGAEVVSTPHEFILNGADDDPIGWENVARVIT